MIKSKKFPLGNDHIAVVEIEGYEIVMWVSKVNYYFFNLICTEPRVSKPKIFQLSHMDCNSGIVVSGSFAGTYQTLNLQVRNIDEFDLKKEIALMHKEYKQSLSEKEIFQEKLNNIL